MSLEGFNINIWFTLPFGGFHSPDNSDSTLVFGIGNSRGNTEAFVQPCVDAVPLLIWVKVKGRETCGCDVQRINLGLDSHIDDRVNSSITIRTSPCCTSVLEGKCLIKGLREFILGSLL